MFSRADIVLSCSWYGITVVRRRGGSDGPAELGRRSRARMAGKRPAPRRVRSIERPSAGPPARARLADRQASPTGAQNVHPTTLCRRGGARTRSTVPWMVERNFLSGWMDHVEGHGSSRSTDRMRCVYCARAAMSGAVQPPLMLRFSIDRTCARRRGGLLSEGCR